MQKETFELNDKSLTLEYDESLIGKDLSIFTGAGAVVATIMCDDTTFTLESNGERDEYWLEVVMYTPHERYGNSEESFSDPIYEMPTSKDDAKAVILDWYQDEINELTKSS